jgi:hypothetical protein
MDRRDTRPTRSSFNRESSSTYPRNGQPRFKQRKRSVSNETDKDMEWKCKAHRKEQCSECLACITGEKNHESNTKVAEVVELNRGCKIPVVTDTSRLAIGEDLPGIECIHVGNTTESHDSKLDEQSSEIIDQANIKPEPAITAEAVVTRRMARDENKTRKQLNVIEGIDCEITREICAITEGG